MTSLLTPAGDPRAVVSVEVVRMGESKGARSVAAPVSLEPLLPLPPTYAGPGTPRARAAARSF